MFPSFAGRAPIAFLLGALAASPAFAQTKTGRVGEGGIYGWSGARVGGSENVVGGHVLFETDQVRVVAYRRMVSWWSSSVMRMVSVTTGGRLFLCTLSEQGPDDTRYGYPDIRLGTAAGTYVSENLGPLTPIGGTQTFDGTTVVAANGSHTCSITTATGERIELFPPGEHRYQFGNFAVPSATRTVGAFDGNPYMSAHVLGKDLEVRVRPEDLYIGGPAVAGQPVPVRYYPGDGPGYAWDLDGDGAFDDGDTLPAELVFDAAGTARIGLKETGRFGIYGTHTWTIQVAAPPVVPEPEPEAPVEVPPGPAPAPEPGEPPFAGFVLAVPFTGGGTTDGVLRVESIEPGGKKVTGTWTAKIGGKEVTIQLKGNLNKQVLILTGQGGKDKMQCKLELTDGNFPGTCWGKVAGADVNVDIPVPEPEAIN